MKNLAVLLLTIFVSQTALSQSGPTKIKGLITGFDEKTDKQFIQISVATMLDPFEQQIRLDSQGNFSMVVNLADTSEIQITYDAVSFFLIASPQDSIVFEVPKQVDFKLWFLRSGRISGKLAEANREIWQFSALIEKLNNRASSASSTDKAIPEMEYKALRIKELETALSILEEIFSEEQIENQLFKNWARAKLIYKALKDLNVQFSGGGVVSFPGSVNVLEAELKRLIGL